MYRKAFNIDVAQPAVLAFPDEAAIGLLPIISLEERRYSMPPVIVTPFGGHVVVRDNW